MRREILNGDGALRHGLLLGQQIGAGRNEIVRRQTRLTDEMVDDRWWWWWSRKFLRRKRRDGRRRRLVVAVVGQHLRRRVNVDGRVRQIRAGQRRATERCRLGGRPVRRWRSESRCRIHRRLPIMLLLLCMWRWRRDVLRLGWQQRQPDRVVRRINVPDPVGRQVFRRIKNGFQDQKFLALLLTDQGQCVDVLFELHPGIFCRKRMKKTKQTGNTLSISGIPLDAQQDYAKERMEAIGSNRSIVN